MSESMHNRTCADGHDTYEEHCEACIDDFAGLFEAAKDQSEAVDEIINRLGREGLQPPAALLVAAQLETLIELITPEKRERLQFEYNVGVKVLDHLKQAQKQLGHNTDLLVPQKPKGLHVVGKR